MKKRFDFGVFLDILNFLSFICSAIFEFFKSRGDNNGST